MTFHPIFAAKSV